MSARRRTPLAKLNPKRLALAFAAVAATGGALFTWHHFADDPTKGKIETGALAVVDLVRESRATPDELVFWLDLVADAMPVARGRGVIDLSLQRATRSAAGANERAWSLGIGLGIKP